MVRANRMVSGVVVLLCLFAGRTLAARAMSPIVHRQSQYLVIAQDNSWKWSPAVAYNSAQNQFLVVWENVWPETAHHDIYGRLVDRLGHMSGEFVVYSGIYNSLQPAVTYDSAHKRYVVVWSYDSAGDGLDHDIYGRFVPGNGPDPSQGAFGIDTSRNNSDKPRVAYGVTYDQYLVVWRDMGSTSCISGGLMSDDGSGTPVAISCGPEVRDFPDVTYNLARNEYMAVWDVDYGGVSQNLDVYARRVSSNGTPDLAGAIVITNQPNQEQHPTVAACDEADQYMFAWQNQVNTSTDDNIYGRWMSGSGALTPIYGIEGTTLPQRYPRLTCNAGGTTYFLTWHDQYAQPLYRWGIWAAMIHTNHDVDPSFQVVQPSDTADRLYPAVAFGRDSALVAWQHARDNSGYLDIWAQLTWINPLFMPLLIK